MLNLKTYQKRAVEELSQKSNHYKNIFNYCGYELPKNRSVDIDNIDDWNLALKLFIK